MRHIAVYLSLQYFSSLSQKCQDFRGGKNCIRALRSAKLYNNQSSTSAQQFISVRFSLWTTCFDQLVGHPQVVIYCEIFREVCAGFWEPKCTWDPKNVHLESQKRAHSSLKTSQYIRTWEWPINWSKHVVHKLNLTAINCCADVDNWLLEKRFYVMKCVFWFSLQVLPKTFLILGMYEYELDMVKRYTGRTRSTRYSPTILLKLEFSKPISEKCSNSKYFNKCIVHLLLFCTMTNQWKIISQIITLLHVSTLSCASSGSLWSIPCKVTRVFQTQLLVIQFTIKIFHIGFMQVLIL